MVAQLARLSWERVDVDCGLYSAHAAIVVRTPRYLANMNVLLHLADHLQP